jgi:two-component system response regulator HydG
VTIRVLVVDDEPSVLLTLAANLELEGFEVETAETGARALEVVAARELDLVFSDIRMPGLSGIDLFRQVKRLRPELPMILNTAFFSESEVRAAVREGVFAVLPKPIDIDQVSALLRRAAGRPLVLVVEEAASVVSRLAASGVRAQAASDGPTALAAVRSGSVDVCVVELAPDGPTGVDVVEELRRQDPSLSVVVFSGAARSDLFGRAVTLGAFACLEAPVDVGHLIEVISRARAKAGARR